MIAIEDCVGMEISNLKAYLERSEEGMLKEVIKEGIIGDGKSKENVLQQREMQYREKALHGQFLRKTEEDRDDSTWL